MEIPKLPAVDALPGIGRNAAAGATPELIADAQGQADPPAAPLPAGDVALIRALDLNSALQILLTEVRDALGYEPQPASMPPSMPPALMQGPADAARESLRALLQALPPPPDASPAHWLAAVDQLQNNVAAAMERAVGAVSAWRDASPAIVDAVKESHALVVAALADEAPPPRAEWAGLAPALTQFRRRRRRARRLLADQEAESSLWNRDDPHDPPDP